MASLSHGHHPEQLRLEGKMNRTLTRRLSRVVPALLAVSMLLGVAGKAAAQYDHTTFLPGLGEDWYRWYRNGTIGTLSQVVNLKSYNSASLSTFSSISNQANELTTY